MPFWTKAFLNIIMVDFVYKNFYSITLTELVPCIYMEIVLISPLPWWCKGYPAHIACGKALGSIPRRVKPKTLKWVFAASQLSI